MKAATEHAVSVGWYSAVLPGQKRIKPLGDYLKPAETMADKREAGVAKVAAMFERMAKKSAAGAPVSE